VSLSASKSAGRRESGGSELLIRGRLQNRRRVPRRKPATD
jgi:hypothetical protein